MRQINLNVSLEEYKRLSEMGHAERTEIIKDMLPASIICGYGYYGHSLKQKDGRFYIVCEVGSSCD